MDAAAELAIFLANLKYEDLSAEAVAMAKADTLDTIGVGIAGSGAPAIAEMIELIQEWGERPQASLLVFDDKYPAPAAATVQNLEQVDDAGVLARLAVTAETAVSRR